MPKTSYTFTIHVEMEEAKARELEAKVRSLGHQNMNAFVKDQIDKAFFALDVAEPEPMSLGNNGSGHWIEEIDISLEDG